MARIETYVNDTVVTLEDKIIGTDALDNSTKNFTVGDVIGLVSGVATYTAGTGIDITNNVIACTVTDTDTTYTAGTGIDITNGVISSTIVDTDTNDIDYIDHVMLNGNILDFVGMGNAFTGGVDLSQFENIYTAGTGIDITNNVISASAVGAYSYIDNVTLSGTDLIFAGLGSAFGGTIDLSGLSGGGTTYTAGTGIQIAGSVISSTVTDTNTTYDYGAVGAGANINITLSGSDNSNDVVTVQAGLNIILTDNGSNTFTIEAAGGGSSTLAGLTDTTITTPSTGQYLTYNGSAWVNASAVNKPENLILRLNPTLVAVAGAPGQDLFFAGAGSQVKTSSVHINPSDLDLVNTEEIEIVNDCIVKVSLGAYIDNGGQAGQITFAIQETSTGATITVGEAQFDLSNQATAALPATFFSFFDMQAGEIYKFTAYSTQHTMSIVSGSFIEFEVIK